MAGLAALPGPAAGQGNALRSGAAAYGGWQTDSPGVRRLIRPGDLPGQPSPARADTSSLVARPAGAAPLVPPGFAVSLVASGLEEPRVIRVAPNGDVFVAESGAGRVRVLRAGSTTPGVFAGSTTPGVFAGSTTPSVFASGLSRPYGIAFWPPGPAPRYVYVADTEHVVRYPYHSGDLVAAGRPETVIATLPGSENHWTRDLAVSADGSRMYLAIGSGSNVAQQMPAAPEGGVAAWEAVHGRGAAWGEEAGRADVMAFDPDGRNLRPYATGLRNCSGLAVQPGPGLGALWCVVNERDGLGDNLPPDYATRVAAGGFYGWPWFYIGDHPDGRVRSARPDLAGEVRVPDVLIQPHSAPLGIAFYTGSQFPAEYCGDAFVTLHGSWNRSSRTGYKVVRVVLRDGQPTGEYEDFLTGLVVDADAVWGRPVGVAMAADGSLLVSEDANGTVWRVSYTGRR